MSGAVAAPVESYERNEQLLWLVRQLLDVGERCPWPVPWLPELPGSTRPAFAKASTRSSVDEYHLLEYGHPFGYLPLREHFTLMLAGLGITAQSDQILMTNGTSGTRNLSSLAC